MGRLSRASVLRALDLRDHRNNAGCALPGAAAGTGLDGLGRSFPAEELRHLEDLMGGLPPRWGLGAPDNVECVGQRIDLPEPLRVRSLGVLGACTGGSYRDELLLESGTPGIARRPVGLGLTDFLAATPANGESCVAACSFLRENGRDVQGPVPRLWRREVELEPPHDTVAVWLPVNPDIHVFGIWVHAEPVDRDHAEDGEESP
ncbi:MULTISPECIES: hypothetical protein [Kitasatospora]|uniref:Uncharacterized protein n=1 Tax=Kitasatospora cystarginea TaxID=58350 RepID=A0ABP5Q804_9ACTN